MEVVEISEGCWVDWIDKNGQIKRGRIERVRKNKPFSEENWWVTTPSWGSGRINLEQIIRVYPKVVLRINPSHR